MSIKSKRITIRIFATFLILSLTLCYFTIGVSASDYSVSNDTVYKSADYWGLEELPFGVNTGVVQFQYDQGYLTLYFDKLSIYDDFDISIDNETWSFIYDHYWSAFWDNSSGAWDYKINIMSDSPIYYKKSYVSNGIFSSTIGTLTTETVWFPDGDTISGIDFPVYLLEDYSLSSLVSGWTLNSSQANRRVYSNCYQISQRTVNGYPYYIPARAGGTTVNPSNLSQIGYNVEYYPSIEYLQNVSLRNSILDEFFKVRTELIDVNNYLYNVNVYIEEIARYVADISVMTSTIQFLLEHYLPLIDSNLGQILEKLDEIKTGPEYDSSQGIGSNTEFGDSVGGLVGDMQSPNVGVDFLKNKLGNALLMVRNLFDLISGRLGLTYVITFLLGMSFIAYVLGRVIKNKMN